MPSSLLLLIGTRKGLFIYRSLDRRTWEVRGPFLAGAEINHAIYDARLQKVFATKNHGWFGSEIVSSTDLGENWVSSQVNPAFSESSGLKIERLWHLAAGPASQPNVLYAGVAPAALFRSENGGETWEEIQSLSQHPTRPHWHPGAGGLCLHSIAINPLDTQTIYVGISAVGVFRSNDAGATWTTANQGTRAEFLPVKKPEFGQCVHKVLLQPGSSTELYQQNHCGVYRSGNGGISWDEISEGLPSDFGFPLGLHPREPGTLYVIPLQGGEFRCPPGGSLRVYRTRNSGADWTALGRGLPESRCFAAIYRDCMAVDQGNPAGIYFGTNLGQLYASLDEGDTWSLVAENLPAITSVTCAEVG